LSGLDGFEEENRLWWPFGRLDRVKPAVTAAARVPDEVRAGVAVATTRRTDEGSILSCCGFGDASTTRVITQDLDGKETRRVDILG